MHFGCDHFDGASFKIIPCLSKCASSIMGNTDGAILGTAWKLKITCKALNQDLLGSEADYVVSEFKIRLSIE